MPQGVHLFVLIMLPLMKLLTGEAMKAIITEKYGPANVLKIEEVGKPLRKAGEILVTVKSVAVNPIDCKIRSGLLKIITGKKPPKILGADLAGIVDECDDSSGYCQGDKVFGMLNFMKGSAYAEQTIALADQIAPMPGKMDFHQAAALPMAALTAYQSLVHLTNLQSGQHLLINGSSGGVGHQAVQIAKILGAEVTAVCSSKNIDFVKSLGADHTIDYGKENVLNQSQKYDHIFDVSSNLPAGKAKKILNDGGVLVQTLPNAYSILLAPFANMFSSKKVKRVTVKPSSADLQKIAEMVDTRALKVVIQKLYQMEEIAAAHEASEEGHTVGKLVVEIS
jgi:NADPH:quinone reductase-like Zn-dependent oxidoreductase